MVRYQSGSNLLGSIITTVVVVLLVAGVAYMARVPLSRFYDAAKNSANQLAQTLRRESPSPTPTTVAVAPALPSASPTPTPVPSASPTIAASVEGKGAVQTDNALPTNGPESGVMFGIAGIIGAGVVWQNHRASKAAHSRKRG